MNSIGGQRGIGAPLPPNQIGGESFIRHVGNDKLIFDFHEGNGNKVYDKSHCGNNGTFGAGAAAPTWKRNSLYFDGGDYINTSVIVLAGPGAKTISIWFSTEASPAYNSLYGEQVGTGAADGIIIFTDANGKLRIWMGPSDSTGITSSAFISPLSYNDGNWNLVSMTWDGTANTDMIILYVNGALVGARTSNISAPLSGNTTTTTKIGCLTDISNYFTGFVNKVSVLNRNLSGIECFQEYLSQKFRGNN